MQQLARLFIHHGLEMLPSMKQLRKYHKTIWIRWHLEKRPQLKVDLALDFWYSHMP
jgi:hypothetical protein